jgi:hypothetical protein
MEGKKGEEKEMKKKKCKIKNRPEIWLIKLSYSNKYAFKSQMNTFNGFCEMVSYYNTLISAFS